MSDARLRAMAVVPHQDDFEFTMGGSFALLRKEYGDAVDLHVLCTSRGASGHHEMDTDECFAVRQKEAAASAAKVGATYACLRQLDGSHVEMQVFPDRNMLGGLWNAIRTFAPDVIFCPPVVNDPLAGVHIDHINTAHAVRLVAYQLCVPHAYPRMHAVLEPRYAIPLIVNVDDSYTGEQGFHIRQDVSEVYETKRAMAECHKSQILEWLPWAGGNEEGYTLEQFRENFSKRQVRQNARYGRPDAPYSEYFQITRWGRKPREGELERLFPRMAENLYDPASERPDSDSAGAFVDSEDE